ncbi:hypothetical protein J6X13_02585 [Candidatus Saccharibacteria bacterium]|nr:hypothetical protein [Candidatus Saccharibacteria bacterium]
MFDKIIIPSRAFLDRFFDEDTSNYKFRYSPLNESEFNALRVIRKMFRPRGIIRIPEVNVPDGVPTPDFCVDGVRFEIKSPKSFNSLENGIKTARRQLLNDGVLVIELSNYIDDDFDSLIIEAVRLSREHGIARLVIVRSSVTIYSDIKKV